MGTIAWNDYLVQRKLALAAEEVRLAPSDLLVQING
jgi:hypothetical protein